MRLLNTTKYVLFLSLFVVESSIADIIDTQEHPEIITAKPDPLDPWYPYKTRPTKDLAAKNALYPLETLAKIPDLTGTHTNLVPWSFMGVAHGEKGLFSLPDIIADKIVDKKTGDTYSLMYHGTTSDLFSVFNQGAKAIRYDVATNILLGMGFYLTASLNEAKAYACERLKQRKNLKPNEPLQALIVVVGVKNDENIKGKISLKSQLSNDKTGDPLDKDIFFKRNSERYNQFSFFSNVAPYLKIFTIVLLPSGFGRSPKGATVQDLDGQPDDNSSIEKSPLYRCNA